MKNNLWHGFVLRRTIFLGRFTIVKEETYFFLVGLLIEKYHKSKSIVSNIIELFTCVSLVLWSQCWSCVVQLIQILLDWRLPLLLVTRCWKYKSFTLCTNNLKKFGVREKYKNINSKLKYSLNHVADMVK